MDFNSNNFFYSNEDISPLDSSNQEFDDIFCDLYKKKCNDIFGFKYDIDLHNNNFNIISPFSLIEETKKTEEESNHFEHIFKENKEIIKNTNSNYKKIIESIQIKMRENINSEGIFISKKTNRGRKPKAEQTLRKHSKFSDDNIIQKIKNICLNYFLKYINKKLIDLFQEDNSNDLKNNKKIYRLSKKQDENSKPENKKSFLNKTMESIFSQNISTKYKTHDSKHNKNLIEELLNEQDEEKRLFFQKIFNLSFLDVLKHFRGYIFIKELSGMITFQDYLNKNDFGKNSIEYKKILITFMNNYEKIVLEKYSRKKKKNNSI